MPASEKSRLPDTLLARRRRPASRRRVFEDCWNASILIYGFTAHALADAKRLFVLPEASWLNGVAGEGDRAALALVARP